jgi:membrane protease YdiL (CAAX protease family)
MILSASEPGGQYLPPGTARKERDVQLAALRPWIRPAAYIGLASVSCFLFTAWTPPLLESAAAARVPLLGSLPGDLPGYWIRFSLSFLLLGAAPFLLALAFGDRPSDLGLRFDAPILRSPWFWCALPAAALIGAIGASFPDIAAFYPYSRDLVGHVAAEGALPFITHFVAYFFLYYLPWELFFRGFLLLALAKGLSLTPAERRSEATGTSTTTGGAAAGQGALAAALVLFQTMPSTMLHVGHPTTELASAVVAGLGFGFLAWKTRSILPGLLFHAAMGLGTDLFIVLKGAGPL